MNYLVDFLKKDIGTQKAIDFWHTLSVNQKKEIEKILDLKDYDVDKLKIFSNYTHTYGYGLSHESITCVIFCAVAEILHYNKKNNMNRVFIANSGGLDSAVVSGLLSRALKLGKVADQSFEVVSCGLPIESNPEHGKRAEEVASCFNLKHIVVDGLDDIYRDFKNVIMPLANSLNFNDEEVRRGLGNVKARLRMIINFFGTTKPGSYVMSTDNLSELYMAFWTLMGDVGAFAPIQHVLKGLEEPFIALALGVPDSVLDAKPTDGLNVHKSLDDDEGGDTDAFKGIYYPHLDAIICHAVKNGLKLDETKFIMVNANLIDSVYSSQETVDLLIRQMASPASVWKRTKGSIGTSIGRESLGLDDLKNIAEKL